MASERKNVPVGWATSGRITAVADTAVLMTNTSDSDIFFAFTDGDALPTLDIHFGHKFSPGETRGLTLTTGLRLWIGCRRAPVEITITQVNA
jgi:hypothetical protein